MIKGHQKERVKKERK